MAVLVLFEAVVIALLAVVVVGLLRSHAEILRRLHDLEPGADRPGGVTAPVEPRSPAARTDDDDATVDAVGRFDRQAGPDPAPPADLPDQGRP